MSKSHGVVMYGILALLLMLHLVRASPIEGQQVRAQSAPAASKLGPADSLELVDHEGGTLSLRARHGRLAWAAEPTANTLSIGFVQFGDALKQLVQTEEFKADLEKKREEYEARYRVFMEKMEELGNRLEGLDPSDPAYREASEEYQAASEEYETWRLAETEAQNQRSTAILNKAFEEFQAAVDVVATRMNIDVVFQATAPDEKLPEDDYSRAGWEIGRRTVLRYPKAMDITLEVREELGLKDDES